MTKMGRFALWRNRRALLFDIALASAFMVFYLLIGGSLSRTPGLFTYYDGTQQLIWSMALLLPMFTRRTWPQTSAVAYVILAIVQLLFGPCLLFSDFFAVILLYSVIVHGDHRHTKIFILLALAMGAFAAVVMTWALIVGPPAPTGATAGTMGNPVCNGVYRSGFSGFSGGCANTLATSGTVVFIAVLVSLASVIAMAYWSRARLYTIRMMQERNESISMREEEERRIATLAERARIARDMHDVVAHTLSIIIIQSDGGRYAGTHDPALARHTMETIRNESERALHDMKLLFAVFDKPQSEEYYDIDSLVEEAGSVSPATTITRGILGTPRPGALSQPARTAMYRLVQEALTNVRKYAGTNVAVGVIEEWSGTGLRVSITDDGRGASANDDGHAPGYGLIGMRERIGGVHGTVAAGPRREGGFRVEAFIPYAAQPSGSSPKWPKNPQERFGAPRLDTAWTSHIQPPAPIVAPGAASPAASAARPETRNVSAAHTAGSRPTANPLPQLFPQPLIAAVRKLFDSLIRSHIRRTDPTPGVRFNWIERLSQWTQRHYLFNDVVLTLILIAIFTSSTYGNGNLASLSTVGSFDANGLITVVALTPLAFRRRFPELSAALVALFAGLQLIFIPQTLTVNVLALLSLYSVMLYGGRQSWKWAGAAALGDLVLFACKIGLELKGYSTIMRMLTGAPDMTGRNVTTFSTSAGVVIVATAALLCLGVSATARWTRSSGSNALVLQTREEALRAEQEKKNILAANMERNRIGASIQEEVSQTLTKVIDTARAGLQMLDDRKRLGENPSTAAVSSAFALIGTQGRGALARMRELLGILRQTGFSDESTAREEAEPRLQPASSLDEQLQATAYNG